MREEYVKGRECYGDGSYDVGAAFFDCLYRCCCRTVFKDYF